MAIIIRAYVPTDYDHLMDMEVELVDEVSKIDPFKRFRSRQDVHAQPYFDAQLQKIDEGNGLILVVEDGDTLIGYIMGRISHRNDTDTDKYPTIQGYVEGLFIRVSHRGKGIAATLIERMEAYFREQHCEYSALSCVAANTVARKLYEKTGYGEQYVDYLKKL